MNFARMFDQIRELCYFDLRSFNKEDCLRKVQKGDAIYKIVGGCGVVKCRILSEIDGDIHLFEVKTLGGMRVGEIIGSEAVLDNKSTLTIRLHPALLVQSKNEITDHQKWCFCKPKKKEEKNDFERA